MRNACFALAAFVLAAPAWGAQDDPRLDDLFAALASAPQPELAAPIVEEIAGIWGESDSPTTSLLYMRSLVSIGAGDSAVALQLLDTMIALNPDFAEGFHMRAVVHTEMDNTGAAITDIERTLALEPRHFSALMGLAAILQSRGDDKAALAAYEAALKINPSLEQARTQANSLRRKIQGQPI